MSRKLGRQPLSESNQFHNLVGRNGRFLIGSIEIQYHSAVDVGSEAQVAVGQLPASPQVHFELIRGSIENVGYAVGADILHHRCLLRTTDQKPGPVQGLTQRVGAQTGEVAFRTGDGERASTDNRLHDAQVGRVQLTRHGQPLGSQVAAAGS